MAPGSSPEKKIISRRIEPKVLPAHLDENVDSVGSESIPSQYASPTPSSGSRDGPPLLGGANGMANGNGGPLPTRAGPSSNGRTSASGGTPKGGGAKTAATRPPPIVDCYGFECQRDDAPYEKRFAEKASKREKDFLREWTGSKNRAALLGTDKLKKLCRKGVPDKERGEVWVALMGGSRKQAKNPRAYATALRAAETVLPAAVMQSIELDIGRTYPYHALVRRERENLRNVLHAIAVQHADMGYCQGLNYVVARLLTFTEPSLAFWVLDSILSGHPKLETQWDLNIKDFFTPGMTLVQLRYLRSDCRVVVELCKLYKICDCFPPEMEVHFLAPWFLTLFAGPHGLPSGTLYRVWDCLFSEGMKVIFRVILILIKRANLGKNDDMEEAQTKLKNAVSMAFDHDELLKEAFAIRNFSREKLHSLRRTHYREYLKIARRQEAQRRARRDLEKIKNKSRNLEKEEEESLVSSKYTNFPNHVLVSSAQPPSTAIVDDILRRSSLRGTTGNNNDENTKASSSDPNKNDSTRAQRENYNLRETTPDNGVPLQKNIARDAARKWRLAVKERAARLRRSPDLADEMLGAILEYDSEEPEIAGGSSKEGPAAPPTVGGGKGDQKSHPSGGQKNQLLAEVLDSEARDLEKPSQEISYEAEQHILTSSGFLQEDASRPSRASRKKEDEVENPSLCDVPQKILSGVPIVPPVVPASPAVAVVGRLTGPTVSSTDGPLGVPSELSEPRAMMTRGHTSSGHAHYHYNYASSEFENSVSAAVAHSQNVRIVSSSSSGRLASSVRGAATNPVLVPHGTRVPIVEERPNSTSRRRDVKALVLDEKMSAPADSTTLSSSGCNQSSGFLKISHPASPVSAASFRKHLRKRHSISTSLSRSSTDDSSEGYPHEKLPNLDTRSRVPHIPLGGNDRAPVARTFSEILIEAGRRTYQRPGEPVCSAGAQLRALEEAETTFNKAPDEETTFSKVGNNEDAENENMKEDFEKREETGKQGILNFPSGRFFSSHSERLLMRRSVSSVSSQRMSRKSNSGTVAAALLPDYLPSPHALNSFSSYEKANLLLSKKLGEKQTFVPEEEGPDTLPLLLSGSPENSQKSPQKEPLTTRGAGRYRGPSPCQSPSQDGRGPSRSSSIFSNISLAQKGPCESPSPIKGSGCDIVFVEKKFSRNLEKADCSGVFPQKPSPEGVVIKMSGEETFALSGPIASPAEPPYAARVVASPEVGARSRRQSRTDSNAESGFTLSGTRAKEQQNNSGRAADSIGGSKKRVGGGSRVRLLKKILPEKNPAPEEAVIEEVVEKMSGGDETALSAGPIVSCPEAVARVVASPAGSRKQSHNSNTGTSGGAPLRISGRPADNRRVGGGSRVRLLSQAFEEKLVDDRD